MARRKPDDEEPEVSELVNVRVGEVSFVTRGAVGRTFLLTKADKRGGDNMGNEVELSREEALELLRGAMALCKEHNVSGDEIGAIVGRGMKAVEKSAGDETAELIAKAAQPDAELTGAELEELRERTRRGYTVAEAEPVAKRERHSAIEEWDAAIAAIVSKSDGKLDELAAAEQLCKTARGCELYHRRAAALMAGRGG